MLAGSDDLRHRAAGEAAEIEERASRLVGDGDAALIEAHARRNPGGGRVADCDECAGRRRREAGIDEPDVDRRVLPATASRALA